MDDKARRGVERIKSATRQVEQRTRFPLKRAKGPVVQGGAWYWTTSSFTSSTITGTTLSTAQLVKGTVTARICTDDGTTVKPDTHASDVTLVCAVTPTSTPAIASGRFVYAIPRAGRMQIIHVAKCS